MVTSFVGDILLPPISLLPFVNRNLDEKFAVLKRGSNYVKDHGYNTMKMALDDGAVVMAYGYVALSFLLIIQCASLCSNHGPYYCI